MAHGSGNSDKDKLIRVIQSKDFSARKSERALNAVFSIMTRALCRGEVVEIPGGHIVRAENKRKRREFHKYRNPDTTIKYRFVTLDARPTRVKFIPDRNFRFDVDEE